MSRKNYHGHARALIDAWFSDDEPLDRYDHRLYQFDPQAAKHVFTFLAENCTHVEGEWAGRPLVPEGWQYQILRDLFGWKRLSDGLRKHRIVWEEVARKNGKSTLGAGVGLYLFVADNEPGAKIFSAATETAQAGIIFDIAAQMVRASPKLSGHVELFKKSMYFAEEACAWRVLSGAPKKSGLNPHGIIFDEVHEQPNRKLWDILETAKAARRQPVTWAATTAGFDKETICGELHDRAVAVRDGKIDDPALLVAIYAADETKDPITGIPRDDWKSPEAWKKANPNLGISVKLDFLENACRKAQQTPAYANTFKRLHLNIWTRQLELWMSPEKWEPCGKKFPIAPLSRQECFGGLDLSSTQDLAAWARVWPVLDGESGIYHFFAAMRFWLPRFGIREKGDRDGAPYELWAEQGFLTLTEGNVIDYDAIRATINEDGKFAPIKEIAADRWNATQIITQLTGDGFTIFPFGQGFASMAGPTRQLMDTTVARTLHHGSNPVLTWNSENAAVETDAAGNWKLSKMLSKKRIDGMVALIMALGRASLGLDTGRSKYEDEGILTI